MTEPLAHNQGPHLEEQWDNRDYAGRSCFWSALIVLVPVALLLWWGMYELAMWVLS